MNNDSHHYYIGHNFGLLKEIIVGRRVCWDAYVKMVTENDRNPNEDISLGVAEEKTSELYMLVWSCAS